MNWRPKQCRAPRKRCVTQREESAKHTIASIKSPALACKQCVGPRPSFGETLVIFGGFGPLLDFNTLVEVGAPRQS
jgi:hypothetical protein